jgi:hypothetical protein
VSVLGEMRVELSSWRGSSAATSIQRRPRSSHQPTPIKGAAMSARLRAEQFRPLFPPLHTNLDPKHERKRIVNSLQLIGIEAPGRAPQTLGVDHRRLLNKNARLRSVKLDDRSKTSRPRARRGRRDEHGAQTKELVRLDDHCESSAPLLSTLRPTRSRQAKDLTAHHVNRRIPGLAQPSARERRAYPRGHDHRPQVAPPRRRSRHELDVAWPPRAKRCGRLQSH